MATVYDEVVQSFSNGEHLYVDPSAVDEVGGFSDSEQGEVETALSDSEYPTYAAVLPSSALSGDTAAQESFATTIVQDLPDNSTVVALFGQETLSAASTAFSGSFNIANATFGQADSVADAIIAFNEQVEETLNAGGTSEDSSGSNGSGNTDGGSGGWLPLAIIAAAGGGGFLFYRRNKRNRELTELKNVRELLDEDITKYGEQLTALDVDLQPTSAVPGKAREEYSQALDLYERAKDLTDRAEKPDDLRPVTTSLEEGRWLLSCVDARIKGETVPERRLPCFFDPAHGPSAEDVQWAPHYGSTRSVPACRACAQRIGQGEDPDSRMVKVGEDRYRPYWDAGPAYSGWAGGYYGGLLPGLMVGTMLGHSMAMPYVDTGAAGAEGGGGDFGGFGGADGGGGDFGGFGGFDGGGGDFGGF